MTEINHARLVKGRIFYFLSLFEKTEHGIYNRPFFNILRLI